MPRDVVIIGSGLFGSIICKALTRRGADAVMIDSSEPRAGSGPAACLMKPGWFGGLGRETYKPSLDLLGELYGVEELQFSCGLGRIKMPVLWCNPRHILNTETAPLIRGRVTRVDLTVGWSVEYIDALGTQVVESQRVIVAAGIWTNKVLENFHPSQSMVPGLHPREGVAFTYSPWSIQEPFIRPWAPYKQIVAFNRAPREVWVSDGTAVKEFTPAREIACRERCAREVELERVKSKSLFGIRPYTPNAKPCFLEDRGDGLWVVTGGAKNGTIAAGWAAHRIREEIA